MVSEAVFAATVSTLRAAHLTGAPFRRLAMEELSALHGYDWTGVYRLEGDALVLDEFVGEETEHVRIAVGTGVCGTAVAENANQIVHDVRDLTNYLSCSTKTRSEIVVLIRDERGKILGQIDVDGHEVNAFNRSDEELLEAIAEVIAERWE